MTGHRRQEAPLDGLRHVDHRNLLVTLLVGLAISVLQDRASPADQASSGPGDEFQAVRQWMGSKKKAAQTRSLAAVDRTVQTCPIGQLPGDLRPSRTATATAGSDRWNPFGSRSGRRRWSKRGPVPSIRQEGWPNHFLPRCARRRPSAQVVSCTDALGHAPAPRLRHPAARVATPQPASPPRSPRRHPAARVATPQPASPPHSPRRHPTARRSDRPGVRRPPQVRGAARHAVPTRKGIPDEVLA